MLLESNFRASNVFSMTSSFPPCPNHAAKLERHSTFQNKPTKIHYEIRRKSRKVEKGRNSASLAMHITVTSATGDAVFPLEIPDDLGVADFKAFCEAQSDIPSAEMVILFNGRSMDDDKKKVRTRKAFLKLLIDH